MTHTRDLPSNWGRWGDDDERGTLNLINDSVRARAASEVRTGRAVSLSRPVPTTVLDPSPFSAPATASVATQIQMFTGDPVFALAEYVSLPTHDPELTHLDAPAHQVVDGKVYPGRLLADAAGATGVRHGGTSIFADGVVTRGVFLDLAPGGALAVEHAVTGADLVDAADRAGVEVHPGDAIVVRAGWDFATNRFAHPGLTLDAVRWLHRNDVSVYAGDVGDAQPPSDPEVPGPLHRVALARLGLILLDVIDPTALVAACAREQRCSFMFVAAALRLPSASGVPVNPLAIF